MAGDDDDRDRRDDDGGHGRDGPGAAAAAAVDPRLLELLVCPLTKARLRYDRERRELVSEQAGLAYPIRDGIPIMLVDEARPLEEENPIPERLRAAPPPPSRSER